MRINPGSASAQRISKRLNSFDHASVRPFTACLLAEYTAINGMPMVAEDDEVLKHSALGVSFSSGNALWVPFITPITFTLMIFS